MDDMDDPQKGAWYEAEAGGGAGCDVDSAAGGGEWYQDAEGMWHEEDLQELQAAGLAQQILPPEPAETPAGAQALSPPPPAPTPAQRRLEAQLRVASLDLALAEHGHRSYEAEETEPAARQGKQQQKSHVAGAPSAPARDPGRFE